MPFSLQATAADLETRIRANRPVALKPDWSQELIFPLYETLSLRNVAHSIAAFLGTELQQPAPLDAAVWGGETLIGKIDRVVAFLMDGMGYLYLQQLVAEDAEIAEIVNDLTGGRGFVPLTSVMPSTTAVALPSLWTGAAPGATGMLGTLMYLRELSLIGDMLHFGAIVGDKMPDTFDRWGLPVAKLVPVPGLAEVLTAAGVETHMVAQRNLMGTGLSRILHRGVAYTHTYLSHTDSLLRLGDALRLTRGKRAYVGDYWGDVDSLAHMYGAHNRYTRQEIKAQLGGLRDLLTDASVRDGHTLVIILADHGHYDAPNVIDLATHPAAAGIRDAMKMGLSGDSRLAYLHVRDGYREKAKHELEQTFGDILAVLGVEVALEAGLFGTAIMPETAHRLGDLLLLPRQGWRLEDSRIIKYKMVSFHAGLDAWEMLIPLLWTVI